MKKVLLWVVAVCSLLLVLAALAVFFKDAILEKITESRIRSQTGLAADIGTLEVSLTSGTMALREFKLENAPEFGGGTLLHIPEVYLALDGSKAGKGTLHFSEVRFHLAEIHVVRGTNGELNLEALQKKAHSKKRQRARRTEDEYQFGGIERLYLSLGKIRYTDLQNPSLNAEHALGIEKELIENIKTEEELQAHVMRLLLRAVLEEMLLKPGEKPRGHWLWSLLQGMGL